MLTRARVSHGSQNPGGSSRHASYLLSMVLVRSVRRSGSHSEQRVARCCSGPWTEELPKQIRAAHRPANTGGPWLPTSDPQSFADFAAARP